MTDGRLLRTEHRSFEYQGRSQLNVDASKGAPSAKAEANAGASAGA